MNLGKLLVVGAGEAGKSTLIRGLVPDAMNLEVDGRTVAMDHATLRDAGERLSIVGVPGQDRFRAVREVLSAGARGVVWVHRSGTAVDRPTVDTVRGLGAVGTPYLVFVNLEKGRAGADGWATPPGLPSPHSVLTGNLLAPESSLDELRDAIWLMVRHQPPFTEKGA